MQQRLRKNVKINSATAAFFQTLGVFEIIARELPSLSTPLSPRCQLISRRVCSLKTLRTTETDHFLNYLCVMVSS